MRRRHRIAATTAVAAAILAVTGVAAAAVPPGKSSTAPKVLVGAKRSSDGELSVLQAAARSNATEMARLHQAIAAESAVLAVGATTREEPLNQSNESGAGNAPAQPSPAAPTSSGEASITQSNEPSRSHSPVPTQSVTTEPATSEPTASPTSTPTEPGDHHGGGSDD